MGRVAKPLVSQPSDISIPAARIILTLNIQREYLVAMLLIASRHRQFLCLNELSQYFFSISVTYGELYRLAQTKEGEFEFLNFYKMYEFYEF